MARKDKKSNPDLTAEWRIAQEQNNNPPSFNPPPYQYTPYSYDPNYQQPQVSQPTLQNQPVENQNQPQQQYQPQYQQPNNQPQYQQPQQNIPPYNQPYQGNYYGYNNAANKGSENKQSKSRIKEKQKKENDMEKQYRSGQRRKFFLRAVLVLINLGLLSYVVMSLVGIVVDSSGNSEKNTEAYITLKGKNKKDSEKIYNHLLADKSVDTFNDYGVIGDDLYLSNYSLTKDSSYQEFYYSRIDNVKDNEDFYWTRIDKLDFSSFEPGDYSLTTNLAKKNPLKYNGKNAIYYTYYSLPNYNGERREITIKGNSASPVFIISINVVAELPEDWYDLVFYAEKDSEIPSLEHLKTKTIYVEEGLQNIYLTNAGYVFNLAGSDNYSSKYSLVDGFTTNDENAFIREMGGYLTGANSLLDDKSSVLNSVYKNDHTGKKAFTLKNDDSLDTKVDNINKVLNNN